MAINKNLPITDINSLIAYAKANPGKMTFAVGSIGSAGHLSTELLKRAGGIDYLVVPYKGTAPAFQDLIGGQIDGFIDPILGSLQYHKSGMLRVVAVTSKNRAARACHRRQFGHRTGDQAAAAGRRLAGRGVRHRAARAGTSGAAAPCGGLVRCRRD